MWPLLGKMGRQGDWLRVGTLGFRVWTFRVSGFRYGVLASRVLGHRVLKIRGTGFWNVKVLKNVAPVKRALRFLKLRCRRRREGRRSVLANGSGIRTYC